MIFNIFNLALQFLPVKTETLIKTLCPNPSNKTIGSQGKAGSILIIADNLLDGLICALSYYVDVIGT